MNIIQSILGNIGHGLYWMLDNAKIIEDNNGQLYLKVVTKEKKVFEIRVIELPIDNN